MRPATLRKAPTIDPATRFEAPADRASAL